MFEFEKVDTRKDVVGPTMVVVPTKDTQFQVSPDYWDEPTVELEFCWKCGPRTFVDGSDRIREPRLAIFCECNTPKQKGPPPIPADALVSGPFDDLEWEVVR